MNSPKILCSRFDPLTAVKAHEGTILASDVVPEGFPAPFDHAYGYLMNGKTMAGHSHATDEIYLVLSGSGYVIVGGENRPVRAGDTIVIPAGEWHTMLCTQSDEAPFLWAALWWTPVEGRPAPPKGKILTQHFSKETAVPAHEGTLLADRVVPEELAVPFGHAYGYIEDGGQMEPHRHPTQELYLIYSGEGSITIDDVTCPIRPGDVIAIPPDALHTIQVEKGKSLLWAALWWDALES